MERRLSECVCLYVDSTKAPNGLPSHCPYSGFLAAELVKAGIEPHPAGNVEAPDPQKMIDLEVCACFLVPKAQHLLIPRPLPPVQV